MRIGISSPIVVQFPGTHGPWETTAGIAELTQIAQAADRLGYHYLTCSEHVAVPTATAATRGGTYWDPLSTLGYLAAKTDHIKLATLVLVLGYHHPLEIAKRYGTLDQLSSGRLILGLGVGSLQEEFELLDAAFTDRGARADDALAALRAGLSTSHPRYQGEFYEFSDVVVEPHAVQAHVPFWMGGRTRRSLRRAVNAADGWTPFALPLNELANMLRDTDLPSGFEVVLPAGGLDPAGDPDNTRRHIDRLNDAGATMISAQLSATSADHYCDQLESLADMYNLAPPPNGH